MEKDVIGAVIGPEMQLNLKIIDGQIVVELKQKGTDGFITLQAGIGPKPFLEKLKTAIPGTFDDVAIDALEAAIGLK